MSGLEDIEKLNIVKKFKIEPQILFIKRSPVGHVKAC
jgi:hypothetical protein